MRKTKIITSICALVGVATPLTILSSCSTGGDKPKPTPPTPPTPPIAENNVSLLSSSTQTLNEVYEITFDFKLDFALDDGEMILCEAQNIIGTNTLSVKIDSIEVPAEETTFTAKVTIFKENGGEPYSEDNVTFYLNFKGMKGGKTTFTSKISSQFKLTYISNEKIVPLNKLVIRDGVLRGLSCSWDDASISDCDTLLIPNNVVEIVWDQTQKTNFSSLGGNIKILKFEEGINPLYIGYSAFTMMNNVETLILPKRLSYIGTRALNTGSNLKTIDISSWDEDKFNNSNPFGEKYILGANIPTSGEFILSSDNSVGKDAYYTFKEVNPNFENWNGLDKPTTESMEKDGFIYDEFNGDAVITDIKVKTITQLTIPSWCNVIKPNAFADFDKGTTKLPNVTSITVQEGSILEKIYAGAFSYIPAKTIDLSNAVNLKHLDNGVFANAKNLIDIKLPSSIESISPNCFYFCSGLTEIDLSQTNIDKISLGAFYSCLSLKNVILTDTISWIGASAFYNCKNLTTTINLNRNITYIGSSAFYGCTNVNIVMPSESNNDECVLSYIGEQAFYMSNLQGQIFIPKSIKYVCDGCFGYNYGVTSIVSNNESYIANDGYLYNPEGELLFACGNSGEIPTNISSVRPFAVSGIKFYGTQMDLSKTGIKTIGASAFQESISTSEEGWFDVILPTSVETIDNNAFKKSNIRNINLGEMKKLSVLGEGAFSYCTKIQNLSIPSSIKSISEECFRDSKIENLVIPNSVNEMGNMSFQSCKFGSIDLSSYDSVPSGWGITSFNYFGPLKSTGVTIYIKSQDLKEKWIECLTKADSTSTLPRINWVVGSPSNN